MHEFNVDFTVRNSVYSILHFKARAVRNRCDLKLTVLFNCVDSVCDVNKYGGIYNYVNSVLLDGKPIFLYNSHLTIGECNTIVNAYTLYRHLP